MENDSKPQSQSSLGLIGIFRESVKATSRNGNLLLPILLFAFLSIYQLDDLAQNYILAPVTEDLELQFAKHPNMIHDLSCNLDQPTYRGALDDILEFLLINFLFLAFSSIIVLVCFVATVSSSYEAYIAKVLGHKEMLLKIRTSWTKPIVTSFYMILITLGIICLACISIFVSSILEENSWSHLFFGFIPLFILVWYLYVAALWMLSVVVSVLEDGFVGVKAIGRAVELMSGKRLQALVMMIPFAILYIVVHQMDKTLRSYDLSRSRWLSFMIPLTNELYFMLTLFMFVVFTVFYHERKTSHDEKEVKGLYLPIAAGEA